MAIGACFSRLPGCRYFLAKYSRTIILISPLTEVPFSVARARNLSMTWGEKKTFVLSLLAFCRGDNNHTPFTRVIISPLYHHVKRLFPKNTLRFSAEGFVFITDTVFCRRKSRNLPLRKPGPLVQIRKMFAQSWRSVRPQHLTRWSLLLQWGFHPYQTG